MGNSHQQSLLVLGDPPGRGEELRKWAQENHWRVTGSPGDAGDLPAAAVLVCADSVGEMSLPEIRARYPRAPIFVSAEDPEISTMVQWIRDGADDLLEQPFALTKLRESFQRAVDNRSRSVAAEPIAGSVRPGAARLLLQASTNETMHEVVAVVDKVADTDITVLIRGESGTGKEVVARAIHETSTRAEGPFVKVNCAALPSELLESELFGFERGAFTGAERRKLGKFEHASGGTIFLDEIGEMSPSLQAKLLQVLQDGEFSRLGANQSVHVDTRVVVATNKDLETAVTRGEFREDLFHRIHVVTVRLPALRERPEDIADLARGFVARFCKEYDKATIELGSSLIAALEGNAWPGNVRELENTMRRFCVLGGEAAVAQMTSAASGVNRNLSVPERGQESSVAEGLKVVSKRAAQEAERRVMEKVLNDTRWNRKEAARRLSISYKALLYKMKAHGQREPLLPRGEGGGLGGT